MFGFLWRTLLAVQCKRRVGQLPIYYSNFSSHVFKNLCLATFEGVHGRFDVTLFWVYLVHFFEMFKWFKKNKFWRTAIENCGPASFSVWINTRQIPPKNLPEPWQSERSVVGPIILFLMTGLCSVLLRCWRGKPKKTFCELIQCVPALVCSANICARGNNS